MDMYEGGVTRKKNRWAVGQKFQIYTEGWPKDHIYLTGYKGNNRSNMKIGHWCCCL